MNFASVYPLYVAKAEKKGRMKSEVDAVICWLTGYNQREFEGQLKKQTNLETFFKEAPKLNPSRTLIKGVVCGVRVEDVEDPLMREIRYLDKLIDELAKGKPMDKILRAQIWNSAALFLRTKIIAPTPPQFQGRILKSPIPKVQPQS
jgi:hypothetical protein